MRENWKVIFGPEKSIYSCWTQSNGQILPTTQHEPIICAVFLFFANLGMKCVGWLIDPVQNDAFHTHKKPKKILRGELCYRSTSHASRRVPPPRRMLHATRGPPVAHGP